MKRLLGFALLFGAIVSGSDLHAQPEPLSDGGRLETTREGLVGLLERYEQSAASAANSAEARATALRDAEAIRQRLEVGDFRTGDVVELRVEGEAGLTNAFVVNNEGALALPVIGQISLRGVLRSELSDYLQARLSEYLVDPRVTANSSIRITITGSSAPGIFVVPTQKLLSTAVMDAGGPAGGTDLMAMRVERGNQILWEGEALQSAIAQGWTVEQMSLRSGDHVVIPPARTGFTLGSVFTTVVPLLLVTITALTRIF